MSRALRGGSGKEDPLPKSTTLEQADIASREKTGGETRGGDAHVSEEATGQKRMS